MGLSKKSIIVVFLVVTCLTCSLGIYYFYKSGSLLNIFDTLFGNKITVISQNPSIQVKIVNQKRLEEYLVTYGILGKNKTITLPNGTANGNVNNITVNLVALNTNYGEVYMTKDPTIVVYSYLPEYVGSRLKLNLYINPDWLDVETNDKHLYLEKATLHSLYLVTHKLTKSNLAEIKNVKSEILESLISEKNTLIEVALQ